VVERAVDALHALDPGPVTAHLGPCIRVGCYEFDGPEREHLADRFGEGVLGTTTWGTPAVDLPAAVHAALGHAGVDDVHDTAGCTACDRRWYSHRARQEVERFATTAWLEAG
jgi:copper oxidase (laccase) domain-containing protein